MKVMGVDPSTKSGIVGLDLESGEVSARVLEFKKMTGLERVQSISEAFGQMLDEYQPEVVCIEGYVQSSFSVICNVEIGVFLRMNLHVRQIPWYVSPPTTLKKWVTGNGAAKKPEMGSAVKDRWGFISPSDDVVDAYCLAKMAEEIALNGVGKAPKGVERG